MIANAIFTATGLTLALVFFLTNELRFLIPFRQLLVCHYSAIIFLSLAILFLNVTALLFTFGRRFFLKDTGRKLAHFDRELNAGRTPMPPHLHREELN
ncbi:MAG TPA: hypothetical protein VJO35_08790 [Terriglobales bacterium]|nr:hypothetical protein [Terriglobales bacterium]